MNTRYHLKGCAGGEVSLQLELAIYERICESYKDGPYKTLVDAATALRQALQDLLKSHAKLRNVGSAYTTERFHIDTRAKEADSLREKLVRTSAGLQLLEVGAMLPGDGARQELHKKLLEFPDALGVKIIGDLDVDVDEIVKVVSRTTELEFESGKVSWDDLANQPQQMRNGRNIYRIKGQFQFNDQTIGVELQIKSKLSDAWSELEHPWFYKNHGYTPVRPVLELGMESVADMLEVLDRFLHRMRDLSTQGTEVFETLPFYLWLHRSYGRLLREAFGHDFPLRDLQELLLHCSATFESLYGGRLEAVQVTEALSFDQPVPSVPVIWVSLWKTSYHVRSMWAILRTWFDVPPPDDLHLGDPARDSQVVEILRRALGLQAEELGLGGLDASIATAAYDNIASMLSPLGTQSAFFDVYTIRFAAAVYEMIILPAVGDSLAIRFGACLLSLAEPNAEMVRLLFVKSGAAEERDALRTTLENLLKNEKAWIDPKAKRLSDAEVLQFPLVFRRPIRRLVQLLREGERNDQG